MNVIEAMSDPQLFGNQFRGESWDHWRALLAGFYGLELTADQRTMYETLTQRTDTPAPTFRELWLSIGRRGGKSNIAALIAVFEAFFNDYTDKLAAGEVATVMVIAENRKQARNVMRYIRGLVNSTPMLAAMVVKETEESLELVNRCEIAIQTATHRGSRGYSVACAILDECAFWLNEGANPDREILKAIRPSLATLDGKLIALSSPYARRGILWEAYRMHYGQESRRILVAKAPTELMNPVIPQEIIKEAYEDDPVSAAAEYGAEFRTDVETFISREVIERCTVPDRLELPHTPDHSYFAFVDPSGGSADAFTLAIAHKEDETIVIDAIRSTRPPFSPESVTADYCQLLKTYKLREVTGDNYAGQWPKEQFSKYGVDYRRSENTTNDIYREALPLLNGGRIELPDNRQLANELLQLERRTSRNGRDTISHPPGGHDDLANAVLGVAVMASQTPEYVYVPIRYG